VWPRPPLLRRKRNQAGLQHSARAAATEFSAKSAPTDSLPVVRFDAKAGQRSLDMLRWGFVPYWAKDINVGFANINAKAEGIESKPAFRKAFERRRCLCRSTIFMNGRSRDGQTALRDRARRSRPHGARGLMGELAFAGWRVDPYLRDYHHHAERIMRRAPQPHARVLKPDVWSAWLGEQPATVRDLKAMLAPYPSDGVISWPVSTRVGNVKNNDPSLIEPILLQ